MAKHVPIPTWKIAAYDPLGFCAYCGSTEDLSDEHIIPFGLLPKGGDWFLPDASCAKCACITKKFEGSVQQNMVGAIRHKMGLKTRRRGKRKKKDTFTVTFNYPDGSLVDKEVAPDDLPAVCIGFNWRAPRLLRGLPPADLFEGTPCVRIHNDDLKLVSKPDEAMKIGRAYPGDFARMLAKIAHVFAIAEHGVHSFTPMLPDFILGKDDRLAYLVGGDESGAPLSEQKLLHDVYRQDCRADGVHYVLVALRLFACLGMPRYHVVVGKKADQNPPALSHQG